MKLPFHDFRPVQPGDGFDNELISDLLAAGFEPMTLEPVVEFVDLTPLAPEDMPDVSEADLDFFIVRDFLEFVTRLTGERLAVNPSIAAYFQALRISSSLYETKELPYNGILKLSFNG